jgi:predicted nucleotidyltransferase
MLAIPTADIRRIARRHRLEAVILFGSRARGTARPDSDVDLCVVGGNPDADGLDLQGELAQVFRRNVDLVRFERSDPVLRFHSVFYGRLLHGSRRDFERLRLRALKEWQDARKIQDAAVAYLDRTG